MSGMVAETSEASKDQQSESATGENNTCTCMTVAKSADSENNMCMCTCNLICAEKATFQHEKYLAML